MPGRKRKTAEELLAELAADGEFQKRQAAAEKKQKREAKALSAAEAPLVRALRAAGGEVDSVWDLVNVPETPLPLVHVLLIHLDRQYPEKILEGIARALAVKHARVGWQKLMERFLAEPNTNKESGFTNQFKWALHLALANAADASVVDDLIRLAVDRRLGEHRTQFVEALVRIGGPEAHAALEELKEDPQLADSYKRIDKRLKRRKS